MEKSNRENRFATEVRARAVRMILEHKHEYANQSTAIMAIAPAARQDIAQQCTRKEEHRDGLGVELVCKVLPIAQSTFYAHQAIIQTLTWRLIVPSVTRI